MKLATNQMRQLGQTIAVQHRHRAIEAAAQASEIGAANM